MFLDNFLPSKLNGSIRWVGFSLDQNIQYDRKVNVRNSKFIRKALSRLAGYSILNDNAGTIFEHYTTNVATLAQLYP